MDKECIAYIGVDWAKDDDMTIYSLYYPLTMKYKQITKEEYENLVRRASPPKWLVSGS